ncbi:phospholipase D-like domain-containing protein [Sulfobacillus thermosulfidooxidans]|uniref:phospholipase D-like domain-containing protein n=1 Tax=Sulfobacillus thermosulfidooxidans TaxID=28034 RepID=UPI0009EB7FE5|nr:phospholipase D-like domain-containing protein [Sulfobacillus thermosulfidooxidans]
MGDDSLKFYDKISLLGLIPWLAGCGTLSVPLSNTPPSFIAPAPSASPTMAPSVIIEPADGVTPWITAIDHARTGIDLNVYLIDDSAILTALRQAGQRGIPIHVLLAPNPYHDTAAVTQEEHMLHTIPNCTVRWAPPRFDQAYAFDHAKYLVINPGTIGATAIIGSPNFTASAFDGTNLEVAAQVTGPTANAAAQVFQADWTRQPAGAAPRRTLVLSPGATTTWLHLLQSPGSIAMMTEEIGDDPTILAQMAADGPRLSLLCPPPADAAAAARLATLAAAGVHIRTLNTPYVHAKTLITPTQAFLGSQNLSAVSLQDNREMGLIVSGTDRQHLAAWFQHNWHQATPWTATASASPASSRPWLPDGASMTTVRHLWGPPERTYPTTYHGQSQIAWVYPTATVYFVHQHLVAVSDR